MNESTDAPLATAGPPAGAGFTRSLRGELDAEAARRFGVENLAGSMSVVRGSGPKVVAVAKVYAESQELADSLDFVLVQGAKGAPTLRLRYPLDRHAKIRYPGGGTPASGRGWLSWFGGSGLKYDGHRVTVSDGRGVVLYADVEVQVPRETAEAHFRNHVGPLQGEGIEGSLTFDAGSGKVTLRSLRGEIVADTGEAGVAAEEIEGSLRCDTGSGACVVSRFKGKKLVCDSGTGRVEVHGAQAQQVKADTGSGNIRLEDVDAEQIEADTASGNVEVKSTGERLRRLKADTSSGDVRLNLGPETGFEIRADVGSGAFVSHYEDAEPIVRGQEKIGYRRGDARVRIDVDTGSGDLIIGP